MAEFGNPDVVQEECDVLMIGGGMANLLLQLYPGQ